MLLAEGIAVTNRRCFVFGICVSDHVECPVSGCTCRCMSLDTVTTAVTEGDPASAAGASVES